MLKDKISGYIFLTIVSNISFAGTMGDIKSCPDLSCMPWFLEFGSGISWSNNANITADPIRWNPSPDGYNSRLGTVPLYTAGIGYIINPLISADVNYTFRGIYKYKKHQVSTESNVQNPLGNRTRYFNLNSNALMFNVTLYGQGLSDRLTYEMDSFGVIQPIIGGGVGVSYNTMSNFHMVLDSNSAVTSVMQDYTKSSFSWQLNAGLEWKKDRFSFDLGYRYFNAGSFKSNNALITRTNDAGTPITTNTIPAWSSTLSANEIYFTAKVAF